MICESFSYNSYPTENKAILEKTRESTEISSIPNKLKKKKIKNEERKRKKASKINIYNLDQNKENINSTSYTKPNNFINNSLFITKNVFNIDEFKIKKEFLTEILIGLKKDEKINNPSYSSNIFAIQNESEINEKHRAVVIEWLSYMACYFSQNNETLFMSINIMDRYITKKKISLSIYQLVGIASYLIASKYEDTNSPMINELIYASKNIYTPEDIISMEKDILITLNFDIFSVSTYQFFSFFYLVSNINNKILFFLGHLILEICLLNIDIMSFNKSLIAIGALLIAKKSLQIKGSLSKINAYYNYDESELKEIQKKIVIFLNKIVYSEKNCLILDKFEKNKYLSVSYIFKCDDKYKMCNNICYKKG